LQYLWVTSYYARRSDTGFRLSTYLAKALLIGAALNTLPALVLAPGVLGHVPFDAGLAALIFSVINLHHFVLDGAIWKLRDGQIARALLRGEPGVPGTGPIRPERSRLRGLIYAAGLLGGTAMLASEIELHNFQASLQPPEPDLARAELALQRLRWMGRESAWNRVMLGSQWAEIGAREKAAEAFERSLAIQPNSEAWLRWGALHQLDPSDSRALERREEVERQIARTKRFQSSDGS
jgi:tetratricopeptide (TPR) repeat protein